MAKKTKTQKIIDILEKLGCKENPNDRSKYRAFTDPKNSDRHYFVGRKGGVRYGRIASKSISMTHAFTKLLKEQENSSDSPKKTKNIKKEVFAAKKSIETPDGSVAKFTGRCDTYGNPLYFDGLTVWYVDRDGEIHRIVN